MFQKYAKITYFSLQMFEFIWTWLVRTIMVSNLFEWFYSWFLSKLYWCWRGFRDIYIFLIHYLTYQRGSHCPCLSICFSFMSLIHVFHEIQQFMRHCWHLNGKYETQATHQCMNEFAVNRLLVFLNILYTMNFPVLVIPALACVCMFVCVCGVCVFNIYVLTAVFILSGHVY